MKNVPVIFIFIMVHSFTFGQEQEMAYSRIEQQMENQAENEETENEDDSFLLQLDHFIQHPLNLNEAAEDDLKELFLLNDLQIKNFLEYRRVFGKLVSIYELQAIPSWNITMIRKLIPFITINDEKTLLQNIRNAWKGGEHTLLFRSGMVLEKAKGFHKTGNSFYAGDPTHLYIRYRYTFKNRLEWGLQGDKDAGEQFFKGKQKTGFDFYSFHFFLRNPGFVKSLAIGDFSVNIGKGLISWQTAAFQGSGEMGSLNRRSQVLRPHTSPGEFNFHRGVGITLQKGRWESTLFVSNQKISGNLEIDSTQDKMHVSSFLFSGYYRTPSELANRNNLKQFSAGGTLTYSAKKWHAAVNGIHYDFSSPLIKQDAPYNQFVPQGKSFTNASIDYSYIHRNTFFFGEAAIDKNLNKAIWNGFLISPDHAVDVSVVHRFIDRGYYSLYSNAFIRNTSPANENGIYAAIAFRPFAALCIDAYWDVFRFPWLKFRVDAPSFGKEDGIRITYTPAKQVEIYSVYKYQLTQTNRSSDSFPAAFVDGISRQNWRIQTSLFVNNWISIRNRCQVNWYDVKGPGKEEGFLVFMDLLLKPRLKPWSANLRLMYFDTPGYDSRIYAFENDVLYSFSIPAFFDKGYRYYLNAHLNVSGLFKDRIDKHVKIDFFLRYAQSVFPGKDSIGSGLDNISGNKRTELKFQLMIGL